MATTSFGQDFVISTDEAADKLLEQLDAETPNVRESVAQYIARDEDHKKREQQTLAAVKRLFAQ